MHDKITMELSQVRVFGADWVHPPQWPALIESGLSRDSITTSHWPDGWDLWWEGEKTSLTTDTTSSRLYTDIPISGVIPSKPIRHWPFTEVRPSHEFFVCIEGIVEPGFMFDSRMLVRLFCYRLQVDISSHTLCGTVLPRTCFVRELEGTGLTVADLDPHSKMSIVMLEKAAELTAS